MCNTDRTYLRQLEPEEYRSHTCMVSLAYVGLFSLVLPVSLLKKSCGLLAILGMTVLSLPQANSEKLSGEAENSTINEHWKSTNVLVYLLIIPAVLTYYMIFILMLVHSTSVKSFYIYVVKTCPVFTNNVTNGQESIINSSREHAIALNDIWKETCPEATKYLSILGKKDLFKWACNGLVNHGMKHYADNVIEALEHSGAVITPNGIWVSKMDSLEDKNNFNDKFPDQLKNMKSVWNAKILEDNNISIMDLVEECCERIYKLALEIFKEENESAIAETRRKGNKDKEKIIKIFGSPTQEADAQYLETKLKEEVEFGNNNHAISSNINSMMRYSENNHENLAYDICLSDCIIILIDANFFTSETSVFQYFLASARKTVRGSQDNRFLPVYVQDKYIYRRDCGTNTVNGLPLPFADSISSMHLNLEDLDPRHMSELKDHVFW